MFMRLFLVIGCLAVSPALLESAAPPAKTPHAARPFLPGYRTYWIHHHGWHRVDFKVHAWVNIPATDQNTAKTLAKNYRMHGWTTHIAQPSKGVFVMQARMSRWRTATYSGHLRTAEAIAGLLRSQGYEARVTF